jgi:predicted KAP-like P-loop ATPase
MIKQPEALRLADDLQRRFPKSGKDAASELRRLHEVNVELLFALKNLLDAKNGISAVFNSDEIARAAISKAEGEKA